MTLAQTIALVAALQAPCPHCPKADAEAIYNAAEAYQLPPDVLVWTAYFEASLSTKRIGKKGELGPVQIMPGGPLEAKCRGLGLPISSWQCAVSVLKDEWTKCGGNWTCFWKVHTCGTDKKECGTKIAKTREWLRHEFYTKGNLK
jgi:hypothetical protein